MHSVIAAHSCCFISRDSDSIDIWIRRSSLCRAVARASHSTHRCSSPCGAGFHHHRPGRCRAGLASRSPAQRRRPAWVDRSWYSRRPAAVEGRQTQHRESRSRRHPDLFFGVLSARANPVAFSKVTASDGCWPADFAPAYWAAPTA